MGIPVGEVFYQPVFKLNYSFFGYVQSTDEPIKAFLHLCYSAACIYSISFDSFLEFNFSAYMLAAVFFSIKDFNL